MPRFSKVRNPTHHQYTMVSLEDFQGVIDWLDPLVDEVLKNIAEEIADKARSSNAFKDSNKSVDVKRRLDFWPDERYRHRHLRASIKVRESKFPQGGWLVKAERPHAHLVEYGHYLVTPSGETIGFVPAHPFLRPAKAAVQARLGAMEL